MKDYNDECVYKLNNHLLILPVFSNLDFYLSPAINFDLPHCLQGLIDLNKKVQIKCYLERHILYWEMPTVDT